MFIVRSLKMSVIEELVNKNARLRSWTEDVDGTVYQRVEAKLSFKCTVCDSELDMLRCTHYEEIDDKAKQQLINHIRSIAYQEFADDMIEELKRIREFAATGYYPDHKVISLLDMNIDRLEAKNNA